MKVDWTKVGTWFASNRRHFSALVIVLSGVTLMFAGSVDEDGDSVRRVFADVGRWLLLNRLPIGFVLLVAGLAAVYAPKGWFQANIVNGWSWRVAGCYAVGLLFGTAAMMTTLWLGDGLAWAKVVAILYFFAIAGLSALAAHWRPTWEAPSFAYLGWVGVLMLLVPAWVALTQLAAKI